MNTEESAGSAAGSTGFGKLGQRFHLQDRFESLPVVARCGRNTVLQVKAFLNAVWNCCSDLLHIRCVASRVALLLWIFAFHIPLDVNVEAH